MSAGTMSREMNSCTHHCHHIRSQHILWMTPSGSGCWGDRSAASGPLGRACALHWIYCGPNSQRVFLLCPVSVSFYYRRDRLVSLMAMSAQDGLNYTQPDASTVVPVKLGRVSWGPFNGRVFLICPTASPATWGVKCC